MTNKNIKINKNINERKNKNTNINNINIINVIEISNRRKSDTNLLNYLSNRGKINKKNKNNLIIKNDKSIDKKALNNIPFTQALRIDKRSIFEIFLYTISYKIEFINIFYYKNEYIHLSMTISLYLFSFLLDITMNCLLYTDDAISEKYHNEGSLNMITSLSLSFASNIISSIFVYFLGKLVEYSDLFELIIKDITIKKYYYLNVIKFRKYLKLRLTIFYIIQFIMKILMTYYITIFCIIYNKSQVSIMINYIYGVIESLGITLLLSIIITIMRFLSLKNRWIQIYRTSQYLYNKF